MKKYITLLFIIALSILVIGCDATIEEPDTTEEPQTTTESPNPNVSSEEPAQDLAVQTNTETMAEGEIKDIYTADMDITGFYLADGQTDDTVNKYDTAYVNITEETKIFDEESNEITVTDLKVGMYVEVVFYGPVAESFPPQANAGIINIIKSIDEQE